MSESQVQEIAALAQLKPSLLKPIFGDLDIEKADGGRAIIVGTDTDLRDHIAATGGNLLNDISTSAQRRK